MTTSISNAKVYLYGNILNNSYNLTKFLRAKGIDAEMFLDDSSKSQQDYPWWEDTHLSEKNLPDWIHYYKVNPNFVFPQKELKRMITDFSKCDIALVCSWGGIIAQRAGVPYFFYSYGWDLVVTDFWETLKGMFRNMLQFKKPSALKSLILHSKIQKNAIINADRVGIGTGYQVNTYIKRLGITHKMRKIRLAWELDKYKVETDAKLFEKYKSYEIVYFMVARHTWKSVWNDMKGNDKFIKAFARFAKERTPNVKLVMIDKGPDVIDSKKLVEELKIQNYVEWVPEMNKDGIRAYNSLPNVVTVDYFWHDQWYIRYPEDKDRPRIGFGSASVEAMSAERPLITVFFDEFFYDGAMPPVLYAFKEDEIYNRLIESLDMGKEGRKENGKRGREFVEKYHSSEKTIDLYIKVLTEILEERKIN